MHNAHNDSGDAERSSLRGSVKSKPMPFGYCRFVRELLTAHSEPPHVRILPPRGSGGDDEVASPWTTEIETGGGTFGSVFSIGIRLIALAVEFFAACNQVYGAAEGHIHGIGLWCSGRLELHLVLRMAMILDIVLPRQPEQKKLNATLDVERNFGTSRSYTTKLFWSYCDAYSGNGCALMRGEVASSKYAVAMKRLWEPGGFEEEASVQGMVRLWWEYEPKKDGVAEKPTIRGCLSGQLDAWRNENIRLSWDVNPWTLRIITPNAPWYRKGFEQVNIQSRCRQSVRDLDKMHKNRPAIFVHIQRRIIDRRTSSFWMFCEGELLANGRVRLCVFRRRVVYHYEMGCNHVETRC
ncbi:hypothetical protein BDY19DRAFT_910472 [Irpex rosettiformis]|uniref:Uncharacterized protein n=1 Tax=Irpex rosettiformis TaxID=378272 RepID=A0ACB8TNL0_9APHY|nr:hypothetical protein BDY19DRAFT_910472 [Irpex rosettiformis]